MNLNNVFVISDTHLGQESILNFKDDQDNLVRKFSSVEEMDELMVENWNKVVRPQDRVYHFGDVVYHRRSLPILNRLNGKKVLIKGNHDIFKLNDYKLYFEDVRAYKIFPDSRIIGSHIPVHPFNLNKGWRFNIHGHLHHQLLDDNRYINICVEQINYTPINLDELIERLIQ